MKKNQDLNKKHHFLVAATLIFTVDGQEGFQQARQNGVVTNSDGLFRARDVAAGQRVTQLQTVKKIGPEHELNFVDVIIDSVTYLGFMTEEEFNEPPAGQQQVPAGVFA